MPVKQDAKSRIIIRKVTARNYKIPHIMALYNTYKNLIEKIHAKISTFTSKLATVICINSLYNKQFEHAHKDFT